VISPSVSGTEASVVFVDDLPSFLEAAEEYPRHVIVLRSPEPPSSAELRRYCLALGGILEFDRAAEIRTVRYEPSIPNSTALSLDALPLHSDGTFLERPPARFMLSFTVADPDGGGVSTFMPITHILAAAPDWVIEALLVGRFLFPRAYDGDTDVYVGPVLYHERSALRIRWRSDHLWRPKVIDAVGTDAQGAVDWLHKFLSTTEPLTYAAHTGETVLVPNTVVLHGRTRLSPDSPRELLRAWVVAA